MQQIIMKCLVGTGLVVSACAAASSDLTVVPVPSIEIHAAAQIASFPFPQHSDEPVELRADPQALNDFMGPPIDLWMRIRSGFSIPDLNDPLVKKHESRYVENAAYFARMLGRSRRYLYYIVCEVEKRGMPMEIAMLPMIESAFNPMAQSHAQAVGLWQFVPATGKSYGLEQNWWADHRRDVIAATNGALDYLQKLHGMFGDWQLALAAYNWGEGAVQRAITKNRMKRQPIQYAHLKLPHETRHYLPKLQAVKNIIRHPSQYGVRLEEIPDVPYFRTVTVPPTMDLKLVAELAEMPLDEFVTLNPAHKRPIIAGTEPQTILLPHHKVDLFYARLEWHDQPLVTWRPYQPAREEKLEDIASKFATTVDELREANGIRGRHTVPAGYALLVPARAVGEERISNFQPASFNPLPPASTATAHTVRRGETLSSVAKRYGLSLRELQSWNRLSAHRIRPGMKLRLTDQNPGSTLRAVKKSSKSAKSKRSAKRLR